MSAASCARDLVRSIVDEGVLDPHAVAEKALAADDADAAREAALHGFAVMAAEQHRNQRGSAPAAKPSSGWESVRERLRHPAEWPVFVPDAGWKPFGSCTADEVRAIGDARLAEAERNASWGRWYHAVADRMGECGAATVSDLDEWEGLS